MAGFTVFDVETPNRMSNRISAIGITVIEDGVITDEFYSLVNPETYFDQFNTQLTGISRETVRNAPTFPELWTKIEPLMSGRLLVAHNAVFDMSVLRSCLRSYGITWKPNAEYLCTVQIGRRVLPDMKHNLNVMCDHYGIATIITRRTVTPTHVLRYCSDTWKAVSMFRPTSRNTIYNG